MAQVVGPMPFVGTIGGLCYYRMNGKNYVRRASSLNGKRMKRDRKFKRTLENAALLGKASKVASAVYRFIPMDERKHLLHGKITEEAMGLLRERKEEEEVKEILLKKIIRLDKA